MVQQQDAALLIRGSPEPRTRGPARYVSRIYIRISALEGTGNVIERRRDTRIRARDSCDHELRMEPLKKRGLAATTGTEESQMLAARKSSLQLNGELGGMQLH